MVTAQQLITPYGSKGAPTLSQFGGLHLSHDQTVSNQLGIGGAQPNLNNEMSHLNPTEGSGPS